MQLLNHSLAFIYFVKNESVKVTVQISHYFTLILNHFKDLINECI